MWFSQLSSLLHLGSDHFSGDLQQFGAQRQSGLLSGSQIHGKANAITFKNELDHPAALKKVRIVAHCEDVEFAKYRKIAAQALRFRSSNENDATTRRVLRARNTSRDYAFAVDG